MKHNSEIIFLDVENTWEKTFLKKKLKTKKGLIFLDTPVETLKKSRRNSEIISVFLNAKIDSKFLHGFPKLRFIATRTTGFDHIDLKACKKKGVVVSNVPTYGENTVAEHTFALILSLSRNLKKAYLRTVDDNFSIKGLMGFDLKAKTLGIIGAGHIGLHVIRIAVGFGMKVIVFNTKQDPFLAETLGFKYVEFEELLKKSDIISLHTPYLPSTKHLINKDSIKNIKRGAILINTARGGLVETDALILALDKHILSGVGLDVLEHELKNHALLHRENVIYTPHMAFYSKEAVRRILDTTIENVSSFLKGAPMNRVSA